VPQFIYWKYSTGTGFQNGLEVDFHDPTGAFIGWEKDGLSIRPSRYSWYLIILSEKRNTKIGDHLLYSQSLIIIAWHDWRFGERIPAGPYRSLAVMSLPMAALIEKHTMLNTGSLRWHYRFFLRASTCFKYGNTIKPSFIMMIERAITLRFI
jgi:hypothetical protein